MRKHTISALFVLFGLALLVAAPATLAQGTGYLTNSNNTGMPDYGSFLTSNIDSVNLASGGISLRIPLISRKGRGFDLSFS
jgi:hypothetical protein